MGACVSVHKNTDMNKLTTLHPQSTTKEEMMITVKNDPEEIFFDSQAWLESDCEDFFSINGDTTTPSCGNSPIHQKITLTLEPESKLSPTTTDAKKQLIELFQESFRGESVVVAAAAADSDHILVLPPKSVSRSTHESISSSVETTPYKGSHHHHHLRKERSSQSVQCCIPSLMRNLSFSERKKRLSPRKTDRW